MRLVPIAAVLAILSAGPAFASGGFSCTVDDKVLSLDAESAFSHGLGEGLLNFHGTAEIRDPFAPDSLRKVKLEPGHLPHHWLSGNELKLRIYSETTDGPFASFDLTVETTSSEADDPSYNGTYRLQIYRAEAPAGSDEQQVIRTGTAECSVG